ncbi:hypothetical protein HKX48_008056 [Thoreauomyces humboldtii]|nr:hypothetical protein HKX48_008056 [Thoreauomyces humboldtii]
MSPSPSTGTVPPSFHSALCQLYDQHNQALSDLRLDFLKRLSDGEDARNELVAQLAAAEQVTAQNALSHKRELAAVKARAAAAEKQVGGLKLRCLTAEAEIAKHNVHHHDRSAHLTDVSTTDDAEKQHLVEEIRRLVAEVGNVRESRALQVTELQEAYRKSERRLSALQHDFESKKEEWGHLKKHLDMRNLADHMLVNSKENQTRDVRESDNMHITKDGASPRVTGHVQVPALAVGAAVASTGVAMPTRRKGFASHDAVTGPPAKRRKSISPAEKRCTREATASRSPATTPCASEGPVSKVSPLTPRPKNIAFAPNMRVASPSLPETTIDATVPYEYDRGLGFRDPADAGASVMMTLPGFEDHDCETVLQSTPEGVQPGFVPSDDHMAEDILSSPLTSRDSTTPRQSNYFNERLVPTTTPRLSSNEARDLLANSSPPSGGGSPAPVNPLIGLVNTLRTLGGASGKEGGDLESPLLVSRTSVRQPRKLLNPGSSPLSSRTDRVAVRETKDVAEDGSRNLSTRPSSRDGKEAMSGSRPVDIILVSSEPDPLDMLPDPYQSGPAPAASKLATSLLEKVVAAPRNPVAVRVTAAPAPTSDDPVPFAYHEVVRNKERRKKMHAEDCPCCTGFYKTSGPLKAHAELGAPDSVDRIQKVGRHRHLHKPPNTPPGYWDLNFPTTQEAVDINKASKALARK